MTLSQKDREAIIKSVPLRTRLIKAYMKEFSGNENGNFVIDKSLLLYLLCGFVYAALNSDKALTRDQMKKNNIEFLEAYEKCLEMMETYYKDRV